MSRHLVQRVSSSTDVVLFRWLRCLSFALESSKWIINIKTKEAYCTALIMGYSSLGAQVWHVLTRDHTVLPATYTFIHKWNEPYLPLTPCCTGSPHWLVLISRPADDRMLSWPGCLGELLRWLTARRRWSIHVFVAAAGNWTHERRVSRRTP